MIHLRPYKLQRVEYDVAVGDTVTVDCRLHRLAGFQNLDAVVMFLRHDEKTTSTKLYELVQIFVNGC